MESEIQAGSETISYNGATYVRAELPRGKKVEQVARMISILQNNPGVPYEFETLCASVGQKYPQDVQAAVIALEMCEFLDRYQDARETGPRSKMYYVWIGPVMPEEDK